MSIEIERRFLVINQNWRSKVILSENFSQVYLNANSDKWATRIRLINNNQAFITLKSSINGLINHEFEYPIPTKDAIELLKLSKYKISKTRYHLKVNEKNWVVDSFDGSNSSLIIAEIELSSESEQIQIPTWCGQEITGIKLLSNSSLAKTSISKLSIKDRLKAKDH